LIKSQRRGKLSEGTDASMIVAMIKAGPPVGLAGNEAGAQAERERRESEWGIEDLDQEEEE
jgi:hypothetical protein